jgi:hypothetical protein
MKFAVNYRVEKPNPFNFSFSDSRQRIFNAHNTENFVADLEKWRRDTPGLIVVNWFPLPDCS